ncbi:MAG TPA: flavodoxin family protein [Gammaproteobacteria bacterium]|nr:flavodoxin family protein [Gammaproteobacteria bacterium]
MNKQISVVYHSGYGHTQKQAEAIVAGASDAPATNVSLISVNDLKDSESPQWVVLDSSDAIVMGAPTYMGSISADFKVFMELSSARWQEMRWAGKLAAGFTNSGSQNGDKQNTLIQLLTFAAQHGMLWITLCQIPGNNSTTGSVDDVNRLGASLGAMAQSDIDVGPDEGPTEADLESARLFGLHIAQCAKRWS